MIDWDASELNQLAADLGRVPGRVVPEVAKVIEKGANNIKRDAAKLSSGLAHAPHYPRSITYDMSPDGFKKGVIEAEIGPDKDRPQGALGNLLEYGSKNNPPITHLGPSLDLEGPRTDKALGDVAGDLLT